MVYALLDSEGKIKKVWHKLNHFTSSGWARSSRRHQSQCTIAAIDPKIIVSYPVTPEGIEQIRSFNSSLPKGKSKKPGKVTYRDKPENLIPGVI